MHMSTNSRFAVAIHTLAFLGFAEQSLAGLTSSEMIAGSVNTNPVVIRRLLGLLRRAGLVVSQPGSGDGWRLAREAGEITLAEVYQAIREGPLFALPSRPPDRHCLVGRNVQHALEPFFEHAEAALQQSLAQATIDDVIRQVKAQFDEVCHEHQSLPLLDHHRSMN